MAKEFMEEANGRTLFFIDELGSGGDQVSAALFCRSNLTGLLKKHAFGIVTTHYLNLKVMAGKTTGIVNGAMAFDEKHLQPMYKLLVGKPRSIPSLLLNEIGLDKNLINRARQLVDEDHSVSTNYSTVPNRTTGAFSKRKNQATDERKMNG